MNSSIQNHPIDRATFITSIPAALIWLGVLAFLGKWFLAWADGRFVPGAGTSWAALLAVFLIVLLNSAGGLYLSIKAWRGQSHLMWQVVSILAALLALWAVTGD